MTAAEPILQSYLSLVGNRYDGNVPKFILIDGSYPRSYRSGIACGSKNEVIVISGHQGIGRLPPVGAVLDLIFQHPNGFVPAAVIIDLRLVPPTSANTYIRETAGARIVSNRLIELAGNHVVGIVPERFCLQRQGVVRDHGGGEK